MNIRNMKYFVDAVETENFTMVAKKNFISQTAISQQIIAIENEIGTSLFDRKGGCVKVNAQGMILYDFCRNTLASYQETVDRIKASIDIGKRNITIAITQVGSELLPDMLSAFSRKFADVTVKIKTTLLTEMPEMLKSGEVDLAIGPVYDFVNSGALETEVLYSERSGIIISKSSSLAEKKQITMDDIARETVIMLAREGAAKSREHLLGVFKDIGFNPARTIEVNDMKAQAVLVSAGMGIAFVSESANIDRENNIFSTVEGYDDAIDVALAWKKNTSDKSVRQFIKCCIG